MNSNIYMATITAAVTEAVIDLSELKNITIQNLDGTDTIDIAWDQSMVTATEKITLGATTGTFYKQEFGAASRGGLLYYKGSANTPDFKVVGYRK